MQNMYYVERKTFAEPSCEVICFDVEDILATSDGEDWGGGDADLWSIDKP